MHYLMYYLMLGLGRTMPDPAGTHTMEGDLLVPMGHGVDSGIIGTSLLYNEYPFHHYYPYW